MKLNNTLGTYLFSEILYLNVILSQLFPIAGEYVNCMRSWKLYYLVKNLLSKCATQQLCYAAPLLPRSYRYLFVSVLQVEFMGDVMGSRAN